MHSCILVQVHGITCKRIMNDTQILTNSAMADLNTSVGTRPCHQYRHPNLETVDVMAAVASTGVEFNFERVHTS